MFDPWTTAWATLDAIAAPAVWPARQLERLRQLVVDLRAASPAWRERLRGADLAAPDAATLLRSLPVTRKPALMADFAGWVTDPSLDLDELRAFAHRAGGSGEAWQGRYCVWESSGSSGVPALFVADARTLAVADAIEATRGPFALTGTAWPGSAGRVAFVGATDGPFASIVSLQRLRRLNPWAAAATRPFSFLQPQAELFAALEDWRPDVVATYPSMARVLAEARRDGRLRLALKSVWTGGETLGPAHRRAIVQAFGCSVRDTYGASECLNIAGECTHGRLHLHADWVALEPVDTAGRPVPPGRTGATTLLTNLANRVQPILRYDLGDRVRFVPEPCPCGSPLPVVEVEGRDDDVLRLAGAGGRPVDCAPLALATVLEEEGGVFDFRLVQLGAQRLRLELYGADAATPAPGRAARAALRGHLAREGLDAVRIEVRRHAGDAPPRGRTGKQQRIVATRRAG